MGVYPSTYYSWRKKYRLDGEAGFKEGVRTKKDEHYLRQLEDEIALYKQLLAEKELELALKDDLLKKVSLGDSHLGIVLFYPLIAQILQIFPLSFFRKAPIFLSFYILSSRVTEFGTLIFHLCFSIKKNILLFAVKLPILCRQK